MCIKMSLVQSSVIAFAVNLILYLVNCSESHSNCEKLVRSTCTDDNTTKWNKDSVGENLREWITSISEIRSISETEKEHYFLGKTISKLSITNKSGKIIGDIVQFIANSDCANKRNIGPTWRKASKFSRTQFDDGFLYGIEDDSGKLTGSCVICCEKITINDRSKI